MVCIPARQLFSQFPQHKAAQFDKLQAECVLVPIARVLCTFSSSLTLRLIAQALIRADIGKFLREVLHHGW
jgi:hypothetical protein